MKPYYFVLLALALFSCKKTDKNECVNFRYANVLSVSGPDSVQVGQQAQFVVEYPLFDGCGKLDHFVETQSGDTTKVEMMAKYEGCVCTQVYTEKTIAYTFVRMQQGNFIFTFKDTSGYNYIYPVVVY